MAAAKKPQTIDITVQLDLERLRPFFEEIVLEIGPTVFRSLLARPMGELLGATPEPKARPAPKPAKPAPEPLPPRPIHRDVKPSNLAKPTPVAKSGHALFLKPLGYKEHPEAYLRRERAHYALASWFSRLKVDEIQATEFAQAIAREHPEITTSERRLIVPLLEERGLLTRRGQKSATFYIPIRATLNAYLAEAPNGIEEHIRPLMPMGCFTDEERLEKVKTLLRANGGSMLRGDLVVALGADLTRKDSIGGAAGQGRWNDLLAAMRADGSVVFDNAHDTSAAAFRLVGKEAKQEASAPKSVPPPAPAPQPPPAVKEKPRLVFREPENRKLQRVFEALCDHPAGPMLHNELADHLGWTREALKQVGEALKHNRICKIVSNEEGRTQYVLDKIRAGHWFDRTARAEQSLNGAARA